MTSATTALGSGPGIALATIELPVTGMTCASCQSRLQNALGKQAGVSGATVNLLMENATVTYDPLVAAPGALIGAIQKTGYGASLPKPRRSPLDAVTEDDAGREQRYREVRTRAAWAFALGLVVMLLSSPLMERTDHAHTADALAMWLARVFDAPVRGALPWLYTIDRSVLLGLSLALTTVILAWAGREFFTRGWIAAKHGSADMNTLVALGTGVAFLYSVVATFWPGAFAESGIAPDVYYEAVAMIIGLVLVGRTLEARATRQTAEALRSLVALQPPRARVMRDGKELELPIEEIHPGEVRKAHQIWPCKRDDKPEVTLAALERIVPGYDD